MCVFNVFVTKHSSLYMRVFINCLLQNEVIGLNSCSRFTIFDFKNLAGLLKDHKEHVEGLRFLKLFQPLSDCPKLFALGHCARR